MGLTGLCPTVSKGTARRTCLAAHKLSLFPCQPLWVPDVGSKELMPRNEVTKR